MRYIFTIIALILSQNIAFSCAAAATSEDVEVYVIACRHNDPVPAIEGLRSKYE